MASLKFSMKLVMLILFCATSLYLMMEHLLRYSFGVGHADNPPTITLVQNANSNEHTLSRDQLPRRVLFFGFCRHYHDFDARFAQYSIESLPKHEFYTVNLDELGLNQDMAQLNQYAVTAFNLTPSTDKWQWTLWPTCGQYKNPIYLAQRESIKASKSFFGSNSIRYPLDNQAVDRWHHDVYWPSTAHTVPLSRPSRNLLSMMPESWKRWNVLQRL